jgi:sugar O-acyltransferase (sialic acid O-acetyltransferase NeuD family)
MGDRSVIVVGAGGHAVSVAETVCATGYTIKAFVSASGNGGMLLGIPVITAIPADHVSSGGAVVLAIGDNFTREKEWARLASAIPVDQLPAVVHPTASISRYASLGAGSVVMQGTVVGSGACVGLGCLLNSGSVLEHECEMADFASLAPGVLTGGRVRIGARSALSIGAVVRHGLSIGSDTVVGAASYVNVDIPSGVVAYGTPARVVRGRQADEPYLA